MSTPSSPLQCLVGADSPSRKCLEERQLASTKWSRCVWSKKVRFVLITWKAATVGTQWVVNQMVFMPRKNVL